MTRRSRSLGKCAEASQQEGPRLWASALQRPGSTTNALKPNSQSPSSIKDQRSRSGGRAPRLSQAPAPAAPEPQPAPAPASPGSQASGTALGNPPAPASTERYGPVAGVGSVRWQRCPQLPSWGSSKKGGEKATPQSTEGFQVSCSGKVSFVEEVWGPSARLQSVVLKGGRVRMEVCLALSPGDCRSVPEGPSLHFRMKT